MLKTSVPPRLCLVRHTAVAASLGAVLMVHAGASEASAQRAAASAPPRRTEVTQAAPAEDTTERARVLFEQGLEAVRREAWEEAREAFEQAWALAERPSILVNLGTAQRQSGQLIAARESFRTFLDRFATHAQAAEVRSQLEDVENLMPHLTVHVEEAEAGDVVLLDGEVVTVLDRPFDANPGLREVSLRRGDRTIQSVRVRVELQGNEEVFLRGVTLRVEVPVETTPPPASDNTGLIVGLTIGGVLIVAGGVVLGVFLATPQQSARPTTLPTVGGGLVFFE